MINRTVIGQIIACCFCVLVLLSCTRYPDKPPECTYFTQVTDLSISHDGSQILFTGCGHIENPKCTIYRFDWNAGKLYRYRYHDDNASIRKGRYATNSRRFVFLVIPQTKEKKNLYDDMQIAGINDDGTGYKHLTNNKGLKVVPMLSHDEKTLVYFRGKERKSGRTTASDFDLYKLNLATGMETQLTNLSLYEVSEPHFSPDGRHIIFSGGPPLRLPHTDHRDIVKKFRDAYTERYKENVILQYPLDGSGINREPVPMFTSGVGSRYPMVTRDGSIWFEGITRGIRTSRRLPDGTVTEIPREDLGGTSTTLVIKRIVSFDGQWLMIFYDERAKTGHVLRRWLGMYNVATKERRDLVMPATAENITIHEEDIADTKSGRTGTDIVLWRVTAAGRGGAGEESTTHSGFGRSNTILYVEEYDDELNKVSLRHVTRHYTGI